MLMMPIPDEATLAKRDAIVAACAGSCPARA